MDEAIRLAAFKWLEEQARLRGDAVFTRSALERGFEYQGDRVTMVGPSGIWKPRQFKFVPLSITTIYNSMYDDSPDEAGINYCYRGNDPNHRDNAGLREAMQKRIPLIYFYGIGHGKYLAEWPVFISGDDPAGLVFKLDFNSNYPAMISSGSTSISSSLLFIPDDETEIRRGYYTSQVKARLHQRTFRERVIEAYREQCAFCKLRHTELLDAAHIIPDSDYRGEPRVTNGLSLCKIHHAAYDRDLLSVSPDYRISVRKDVLDETDGPMLRYGIQQLNNQVIILPHNKKNWPDRDRLDARHQRFIKAG